MTIQERAAEAASWFERALKHDGTTPYTRTRDGAPEWVKDLCYQAHAEMLPDDWRYEAIHDALEAIAEADDPDDPHDWADSYVDVYTGDLINWLRSDLRRVNYCDEAADEIGEDLDIVGRIAAGQYREAYEIWSLCVDLLRELEK